jgi:hypothetical protein
MKQLLSTYQPSATAFNGLGVYDPHDDGTRLSNNSVRWIGVESDESNQRGRHLVDGDAGRPLLRRPVSHPRDQQTGRAHVQATKV